MTFEGGHDTEVTTCAQRIAHHDWGISIGAAKIGDEAEESERRTDLGKVTRPMPLRLSEASSESL
jgi:hypothetical protein